jgi:DNA-directed RNA polymerase subunit E'
MGKIGITCRQPFLGALEWVEKEIRRAQGGGGSNISSSSSSGIDESTSSPGNKRGSVEVKAGKKDKR